MRDLPKRSKLYGKLEEAIALYEEGITPRELGEKYGMTAEGIRYILASRGVKMRGRLSKLRGKENTAANLYVAGMSTTELAEKYDVDASTVYRILVEWGVVMRDLSTAVRNAVTKGRTNVPRGERHYRWCNGRKYAMGYVLVKVENHPRSDATNYVREHILVMGKHLGRDVMREEVVHHIDGNKANNTIENLMLFKNQAEHVRHHARMRKGKPKK